VTANRCVTEVRNWNASRIYEYARRFLFLHRRCPFKLVHKTLIYSSRETHDFPEILFCKRTIYLYLTMEIIIGTMFRLTIVQRAIVKYRRLQTNFYRLLIRMTIYKNYCIFRLRIVIVDLKLIVEFQSICCLIKFDVSNLTVLEQIILVFLCKFLCKQADF